MPCAVTNPVLNFGISLTSDALLNFGIGHHSDAFLNLGIAVNFLSPPRNPVGVHIGGGILQIHVDPPEEGIADAYEIRAGFELSGPYFSFSNSIFKGENGLIYNFPLGTTVYVQVRALAAAFNTNGIRSDWVQVRRGLLHRPKVMMRCIAPDGSQIPEAALFVVPKLPDKILAFRSDEEINF